MKININLFDYSSPLYPFRWFILSTFVVLLFMVYHNINGGRMFTSGKQQEWNSSGPAYHK